LATVQVFGRFNGRVSGPGKLGSPRNAFWEILPDGWLEADIPSMDRHGTPESGQNGRAGGRFLLIARTGIGSEWALAKSLGFSYAER